MARIRRAEAPAPHPASIALQAYPTPADEQARIEPTPQQILVNSVFSAPGAQGVSRERFGRAISMSVIEMAITRANRGSMRDITDLSRETIDTDPALASLLQKRFGALSSLPFEIQPAEGAGIDPERAMFYAEVVREQVRAIRNFREDLYQMAWALFDNRSAHEIHWINMYPGQGPASPQYGQVRLAVRELAWVHPRRLNYGPYRELRIQDERDYSSGNFRPAGMALDSLPFKFVQWMPQLFGDYAEREGLATKCMYWSFFKRFAARERMQLTELFGKPFRVLTVPSDSMAGDDELKAADKILDNMGAAYTARLPRGTALSVISPESDSGQIHESIIQTSDEQLAKLILGQAGTTNGVSVGLNGGSVMDGMVDEQLTILIRDAAMLSEVIETQLTDSIIALNFGAEAVGHAPRFVIRADRPADRNKELERLEKALNNGLSIARDEAYEMAGFRIPTSDEVTISLNQPPTPPGAANAPPPRATLIYPAGQSPAAGEQLPPPPVSSAAAGSQEPGVPLGTTEVPKVVTVEEARRGMGLPPLGDERDQMMVAELARTVGDMAQATDANANAANEARTEITSGAGELGPELRFSKILPTAQQPVTIQLRVVKRGDKWEVLSEDGSRSFGEYKTKAEADERLRQVEYFKQQARATATVQEDALSAIRMVKERRDYEFGGCGGHGGDEYPRTEQGYAMLVRNHAQPITELGSVEGVLERQLATAQQQMELIARRYSNAVDRAGGDVVAILQALDIAAASIDPGPLAESLANSMMQSYALGALDSLLQASGEGDESEEFEDLVAEQGRALQEAAATTRKVFTSRAIRLADFDALDPLSALEIFESLSVVPKSIYESMDVVARRRAFTVAGLLNQQALLTVRAELAKQIEEGSDLRTFSRRVIERLTSAGFLQQPVEIAPGLTAMSASHVETVYRTNVLNAYNRGRAAQQQTPEMQALRPVWEARAIRDSRTRPAHRAAHGKQLLATDPFWQTAYPPYGFQCRCRVITKGRSALKSVVDGSTIKGLPDKGFVSGLGRV